AAGSEFAIAAVADHQIAIALRALLIERDIGDFLALIEAASGFAIRISGAGHELAEAPALQNHHTAAIPAVFFGCAGFLHVGGIRIGQVNGILFGEGAAVGIVFIVGAAGVKRSVLAPLDDQGRAAALAFLVGGLLHALDVFHVLLRIAKVLLKFLVELGE